MAADIDIDLADRTKLTALISHVAARQGDRRHASGIYVTDIPYDPVNDCAAIDYKTAEARGYFKIDLLNMSVYDLITDADHYQKMLDIPPDWTRLWTDPTWAQKIVHVGNYTALLSTMRPDSIPRMAAFISVIRPGKAHLQTQPWSTIFQSVWDGDNSRGYVFKKSHAVSYAALVALHINLLS